jgi:hypothetical protein
LKIKGLKSRNNPNGRPFVKKRFKKVLVVFPYILSWGFGKDTF